MKISFKTILWTALAAFVLNLFFGRFLLAHISTWPLLNRFKLLSPQAPIVINNREEIRLTDSGQINDAVNSAKSKISSLVFSDKTGYHMLGAAVNLTSDGIFVYGGEILPKGENWLVLADQRTIQVKETAEDPATGLVFLKVNLNNIPTAPLADTKKFLSGEKLIYFNNNTDQTWQAWPDYLVKQENDRDETVAYAGKVSRSLQTANLSSRTKGKVVLDIKGEVAGLVVGEKIIPADAVKVALNLFMAGRKNILRPDFDFTYSESLPTAGINLPNSQNGPVILSAGKNSPLRAADIITQVNGKTLGQDLYLEEILEEFKPGDAVNFKISRQGKILDLTIKTKELK
jgi:S1-C subfamily serine protease